MIACLLAFAFVLPSIQDAAPDAAAAPPVSGRVAPDELADNEAARIDDDFVITLDDLYRYLATVQARQPDGEATLRQVLGEQVLAARAAEAGLSATDAEVDAYIAWLDEELRAQGGGGLLPALVARVDDAELRHVVRLSLLHERLVRLEDDLTPDAPLSPERLAAWLEQALSRAELVEAPLDDEAAARWSGGTIDKVLVGRRLVAVLPPPELAGVLTEMIGVRLVRRAAESAGVGLTAADATREILMRDAALRSQPGAGDASYEEFAEVVLKRSLAELLASEKFATELLLRLLAEHRWSEDDAAAFHERTREAFAADGVSGTWEEVRGAVWRELRQALYRDLFRKSTIVRRY